MSCGCTPPYYLNPNTGLCEKIIVENAEVVSTAPTPPLICPFERFMFGGTALMSTIHPNQFPLTGVLNETPKYSDALGNTLVPEVILVSGDLWVGGTTSKGRMNQAGIGLNPPAWDWQGYSACVEVKDGDVLWIAVAATYAFRIYIDQELFVVNQQLAPVTTADYLHVFPVELSIGKHSIVLEALSGFNQQVPICLDSLGGQLPCTSSFAISPVESCPNLGAFVFEIYKNVSPQILANITQQEGLNEIYAVKCTNAKDQYISSLILRGPMDVGVNSKYYCSEGMVNGCVEGWITCKGVQTIPPEDCCFTLINCSTASTIVTHTDLTSYLGKVIKVSEYGGCFLINLADDCTSSVSVTVTSFFDSCEICGRVYYKLVDCLGVYDPIYTYTDLSEHVSKVIKIQGRSSCWIVVAQTEVQEGIEVTIVSSYETCEEC